MKIQNQGFDHVEFVVRDASGMGKIYERMGFERIGERKAHGIHTLAYAQGLVRILLSQPDHSPESLKQESTRFLNAQDEGVCVLALDVADAREAFTTAVSRGAKPAMEPKRFESAMGSVTRAEIWTPGKVRYAFMERKGTLFDEGLVVSRLESPSPLKIRQIDHLTNNVSIGEMKKWVDWYKQVFDFIVVRHFDIRTGRTGLISDVVQSKDGKVIVPINEATEPASQVQEFVDRLKGPGVQHLALQTTEIMSTVSGLKKSAFKFLTVPHTYYEVVPTRVPGVTENLTELEELGILLDGETKDGYLLQIFSEENLGPFFFEYIQRKGDKGFGEGNFRALFESIERDQIRRGVLKA